MFNQKEYMKKYHKQWYIKNRERELEKNKKWCKNNPEYFKKYYLNNKDKIKELIKKHQKEWHKNYLEYQKRWQKENKKKFLECKKRWLKSENGKASNQRSHIKRRANENNIINTLTAQEWQDILKQYNFKYAYCGKDLFNLFIKPEKDHIIPVSKGGDNTKENVIPACRSCNAKKHNKIIKEVNFNEYEWRFF